MAKYKVGDIVRPKKGLWLEGDYKIQKIITNEAGKEIYSPFRFYQIGLLEEQIEGLVNELDKEEKKMEKYIVTAKAGYWFSEFEYSSMIEAMNFIDELFDHFRRGDDEDDELIVEIRKEK